VRYPCPQCDYKATRKHDLTRHISAKHPAPSEEAVPAPNLDNKSVVVPENKLSLDFSLKIEDDLSAGRHDLVNSSGSAVQYACSACHFQAGSHRTIRRHIVARHSDRAFACDSCDYLAANQPSLGAHVRKRHQKLPRRTCNLCDFKAGLLTELKRHMKVTHARLEHSTSAKIASNGYDDMDLVEKVEDDALCNTDNGIHESIVSDNELPLSDSDSDSRAIESHEKSQTIGDEIGTLKCANCEFSTAKKKELRLHKKAEHLSEVRIF
jgi:hypothetical protein